MSELLQLEAAIKHIRGLDPEFLIDYSMWTEKFFVTAKIEVSNGAILVTPTEHRQTPNEAVIAYFRSLMEHEQDEFIVTGARTDHRREYTWNGLFFEERYSR